MQEEESEYSGKNTTWTALYDNPETKGISSRFRKFHKFLVSFWEILVKVKGTQRWIHNKS